jgi:hypothetical protein
VEAGIRVIADRAGDVELKEPSSWKGLFGAVDGWSGGQGADSELYG